MGVDGIGSGARPPAGLGPGGVVEPDPLAPLGSEGATGTVASTGAEGARAAELDAVDPVDVGQYLDARVGEATRHLEGQIPDADLAFIRESLREELSTDPVLVELLRRATPPDARGG